MIIQEVKFNYKKKDYKINLKVCNFFQKISGLMFTRKDKAQALLFENPSPIHSLFVFFPFLAIWLDKKDKVIQIDRVKPFTLNIKPKKSAVRLLEIPINKKYKEIIKRLKF